MSGTLSPFMSAKRSAWDSENTTPAVFWVAKFCAIMCRSNVLPSAAFFCPNQLRPQLCPDPATTSVRPSPFTS